MRDSHPEVVCQNLSVRGYNSNSSIKLNSMKIFPLSLLVKVIKKDKSGQITAHICDIN